MAKKVTANTTSLCRTLRALLLTLQPAFVNVGYHGNPKNRRTFSCDCEEGFRVDFEGNSYFVRLNRGKDMKTFELLIGHTRDRKNSGNTPDVSFTELNFGPHFLLVVAPSLHRCGGKLAEEPKGCGDFPALVIGKRNRFLMGFPDVFLFPRLFGLCLAKKNSIDLSQTKYRGKTAKQSR